MAKKCSVEACNRDAYSRGLCSGHYSRWRRGKEINIPLDENRSDQAKSAKESHVKDITGEKYGDLTVVKYKGIRYFADGSCIAVWECQCDCGDKIDLTTKQIRVPSKKSYADRESPNCRHRCDRNYEISNIATAYQRTMAQAKKRGIYFEIPFKEYSELIFKNCFYCLEGPCKKIDSRRLTEKDVSIYCNGLDRIDSSKGYTLDNVVPCCTICNSAKNDKTYEEFIEWIGRLSRNYYDKLSKK